MRVLGIDPGLSGALAFWDGQTIIDAIDMPVSGDDKASRRVTAKAVKAFVLQHQPRVAVIERVNAMPSIPDPDDPEQERRSMGTQSAFRFGFAAGTVYAVMACCDVPFKYVMPQTWKRAVGLVKGSTKEDSRLLALKLFPEAAALLARKRDENRAEAALMAYWGFKYAGLFDDPAEPRLI